MNNILTQLVLKANSLLSSPSTHGISQVIGSSDKKAALESLVSIFEKIKCSDLLIDKSTPLTSSQQLLNSRYKGKVVFYYPLVENDKFTLAIFAFPPHTTIPIHDHPQMTVLSKVLYGNINCKSFDWIRKSNNEVINNLKFGKAKYLGDRILSDNDDKVKITLPVEENIHSFETLDDHSAVLDLLYPPYEQYKRDCTYYRPVINSINEQQEHSITSSIINPTTTISKFNINDIIDFESYSPDFNCINPSNHRGLIEIHKELSSFDSNINNNNSNNNNI